MMTMYNLSLTTMYHPFITTIHAGGTGEHDGSDDGECGEVRTGQTPSTYPKTVYYFMPFYVTYTCVAF